MFLYLYTTEQLYFVCQGEFGPPGLPGPIGLPGIGIQGEKVQFSLPPHPTLKRAITEIILFLIIT